MTESGLFPDEKRKKYAKELAHRHLYQHVNKGIFKRALKIRRYQYVFKVFHPRPVKLRLKEIPVMYAQIKNISDGNQRENDEEYGEGQ